MKTALFVCVHNSGRSQMAEAFFNRMAKGKARAISAGSQPPDRVNPSVVLYINIGFAVPAVLNVFSNVKTWHVWFYVKQRSAVQHINLTDV
jgi:hypothetical protein